MGQVKRGWSRIWFGTYSFWDAYKISNIICWIGVWSVCLGRLLLDILIWESNPYDNEIRWAKQGTSHRQKLNLITQQRPLPAFQTLTSNFILDVSLDILQASQIQHAQNTVLVLTHPKACWVITVLICSSIILIIIFLLCILNSKKSSCHARDLVLILGWERSPGEGLATHSSVLAWRMSWTEKSGRQSKGSDTIEWLTLHMHYFNPYNAIWRVLLFSFYWK